MQDKSPRICVQEWWMRTVNVWSQPANGWDSSSETKVCKNALLVREGGHPVQGKYAITFGTRWLALRTLNQRLIRWMNPSPFLQGFRVFSLASFRPRAARCAVQVESTTVRSAHVRRISGVVHSVPRRSTGHGIRPPTSFSPC